MAGKGSTPRPITDRKQFANNWDNIFNKEKPLFWTHYCKQDEAEISVANGQECNWCGLKEEK